MKKILFTGGGTGGSIMPLLAIAEELRRQGQGENKSEDETERPRYDFLWVGTRGGPDKEMVEAAEIEFRAIFSGKLRRYFSWKNFVDPLFILLGFLQSYFIIKNYRPDLIISAGGFVGVPVVWTTYFLRVPVLVHQQDARPGLANKLMAPFAHTVTVTFERSLGDYGRKAVWTGNPVRREIIRSKYSVHETDAKFTFQKDLPVILIIGGGTGAAALNALVERNIEKLIEFTQVIHVTGLGKGRAGFMWKVGSEYVNRYRHFEFLSVEQMSMAYTVSDLVVSRCGMGVLTELSYLGKTVILIPIPDSHQVDNARVFGDKEAAVVLDQDSLTGSIFLENIRSLLTDEERRNKLRTNIRQVIKRGANEKMVEIISEVLG